MVLIRDYNSVSASKSGEVGKIFYFLTHLFMIQYILGFLLVFFLLALLLWTFQMEKKLQRWRKQSRTPAKMIWKGQDGKWKSLRIRASFSDLLNFAQNSRE